MELQKYTYDNTEYYVDYRLQQFRSIPQDFGRIEFVEFNSSKGDKILLAMIKDGVEKRFNKILRK